MIHNNRMATSDPLSSTREKANRETTAQRKVLFCWKTKVFCPLTAV